MVAAEHLNPNESLWLWLAFDLREYRQRHKMTVQSVADVMGTSRANVSNFEAGRRRPDAEHVKRVDDLWQTNGHFGRLLTFARLNHDPDWFRTHLEYEASAEVLKIFEPSIVPGLLQTEAYARVVLSASRGASEDVERSLKARIARQSILTGHTLRRACILLDEGVIDRPVGGPDVMRAQLARLLEVSELPHVTLRLSPRSLGYHRGLKGAFKIMTCEERDIAYAEASEGGRLVMDGPEVEEFRIRFEHISDEALGRSASRELIKITMEAMT